MRTVLGIVVILLGALLGTLWFMSGRQALSSTESVDALLSPQGSHGEPGISAKPFRLPATEAPKTTPLAEVIRDVRDTRGIPKPSAHTTPIDVSPGFESLLAPAVDPPDTNPSSVVVRRHRQLASEDRDEAWAARLEPGIRSYIENALSAQGLDPQHIELSVIECRTSGCEIQAAGKPDDVRTSHDLQRLFSKMVVGSFAAEFDRENAMLMMTSLPDGRVGYIGFLPRKRT